MNPRIEKKVSKKLAYILKGVKGFTPSEVWIDKDYCSERCEPHYKYANPNGLTSKQKRQNYEAIGSMVNNMPSVGGGVDYWGEAEDWSTVFVAAKEMLCWSMFEKEPFCCETGNGGYPIVNVRLTGMKTIQLARKYVTEGPYKERLAD